LPKQQKKHLKEKYDINVDYLYITIPSEYKKLSGSPKVIEIMPLSKTRIYKVHIITELPLITQKEDNEIYMSIDLGINNLMTCYITTGKTFIISGRQLLSINRYFDKMIAYYQSIAYAGQSANKDKYHKDTKRIVTLYAKRRKQIKHLLHTATKRVVEIAEKEGAAKIIIGDITYIRENKDIGHVNNQKLPQMAF